MPPSEAGSPVFTATTAGGEGLHSDVPASTLPPPQPVIQQQPARSFRAMMEPTVHSSLDFRKDFFFRRRHGALNWAKVLSVDLERVVRTVDIDALQDNVEHITFCDIGEADLARLTDANFLQLWRLTQLIIEYLLNVQNFLLAAAQRRDHAAEQVLQALQQERAQAAEREEELRNLRREVKHNRKVIRAYERNMASKWPGAAGTADASPQKCTICGSTFVNHDFLAGHYARRHPGEPVPPAPKAIEEQKQQPPQPQPSAADFASFKRDLEASLRAQIADEMRRAAAVTTAAAPRPVIAPAASAPPREDESALSKRLGALESTLTAVLNKNTVALGASQSQQSHPPSRARGLRDDNEDDDDARRALRAQQDAESTNELKEYFRRQVFDLMEEIKQLRAAQQQQQQMQPRLVPQATPVSEDAQAHATELYQRFRPAPLHAPHRPSEPHPSPALPHGVAIVPRHVPAQPTLTPFPPPAHISSSSSPVAPASTSTLVSSPRTRASLRDIALEHENPRFELFPSDAPGLLARFDQPEEDLVTHLTSFALIASSIAAREEAGLDEVEAEIRAQGYAEHRKYVEEALEEYAQTHWKRPEAHVFQARLLAEREARNDALGVVHLEARRREEEQRQQYLAERDALEATFLRAETARETVVAQQVALQNAVLLQAQKDEQRLAETLRQQHLQHLRDLDAGRIPSKMANTPLPSPSPTPSADGVPPYPAASPLISPTSQQQQYPFPSPSSAGAFPSSSSSSSNPPGQPPLFQNQFSTSSSGGQGYNNNNFSRASSLASPAGTGAPTPTAAGQQQQQQAGGGFSRQPSAVTAATRPGALRTMNEEDDDDDFDDNSRQPIVQAHLQPFNASSDSQAPVLGPGYSRQNSMMQQPQSQASFGDGVEEFKQQPPGPQPLSRTPSASASASGVTVPPRPGRSAIVAASSAASGSTMAGSLPPRPPVGGVTIAAGGQQQQQQYHQQQQQQMPPRNPDAVESFVPSVGSSVRGDHRDSSSSGLSTRHSSPLGGPQPTSTLSTFSSGSSSQASPMPSMDQVRPARLTGRRLQGSYDVGGGDPSSLVGGMGGRVSGEAHERVQSIGGGSIGDEIDLLGRRDSRASGGGIGGGGGGGGGASNEVESFTAGEETPPSRPPELRQTARSLHGRGISSGGDDNSGGQQQQLQQGVQMQSSGGHLGSEQQTRRGPVVEYEYSTARQDREPGPEHEFGGLDDPYEEQPLSSEPRSGGGGRRNSTAAAAGGGGGGSGGGGGRLHSDDEGDNSVGQQQSTTAFSSGGGVGGSGVVGSSPSAPPSRTRQVNRDSAAGLAGGGIGGAPIPSSSTATGSTTGTAGRFLGPPPVHHSANFSVTNSADWKSDGDLMDDDVEELIA
jgi:zinc finger protein DZIP1